MAICRLEICRNKKCCLSLESLFIVLEERIFIVLIQRKKKKTLVAFLEEVLQYIEEHVFAASRT